MLYVGHCLLRSTLGQRETDNVHLMITLSKFPFTMRKDRNRKCFLLKLTDIDYDNGLITIPVIPLSNTYLIQLNPTKSNLIQTPFSMSGACNRKRLLQKLTITDSR